MFRNTPQQNFLNLQLSPSNIKKENNTAQFNDHPQIGFNWSKQYLISWSQDVQVIQLASRQGLGPLGGDIPTQAVKKISSDINAL